MASWIAADQTSSSQIAVRNEEFLEMANALSNLPEDMRQVVVLKHLKGRTMQEIADETVRSVPSVAGLLRRGLKILRQELTREGN